MWDLFLRSDVLFLAFIYRRYSDKFSDISEFGLKDFLTTSSLGWELLMSLGQDEPVYTYTDQYTRFFKREVCFGGKVAANKQELKSKLKQFFETI